ncbi:MAG: endonuclease/exonuclease/phosphatase family protein [Intestinibacter sp.]|uniref:endonuclease/exonuclease/phosphatase family protein n=2 Tax=Intestinibacter sp. TaxID=1965304 RepID=UPI002A80104E|nr:endonuclease/exonuclease/phosphatase family protein [Intestinibacter sp.]MDY4575422.1 endonuclease/exonuclease/phosphatase family protein [Intestinibacter sp.]
MIYINIKKFVFLVIMILATSYFISIQDNNLNKIEIKIISYNIHSGTDRDMIPTLFDTINFLKKSKADIICLQEVNESSKVGFQVSSLKEELNMYSHFGANVVNDNGNYGLATYSRYKIIDKKHVYLTSTKEQRGFLHTIVKIKNKKVHVINVHLGLDCEERKKQIEELRFYIKNLKNEYFIILGDFNEGNISLNDEIIVDVAEELNKSNILTFSMGLDRIDYMFVSNNIKIESYEVLIKNMSDHYPIVAKFSI